MVQRHPCGCFGRGILRIFECGAESSYPLRDPGSLQQKRRTGRHGLELLAQAGPGMLDFHSMEYVLRGDMPEMSW